MEVIVYFTIIIIVFLFFIKKSKNQKYKQNNSLQVFLKEKGDIYERFIGQIFEKKGDLVIYNGFIRGYADGGVDIIVISIKRKTIELIQCKDWSKKRMFFEDIEDIYRKLDNFNLYTITHTSTSILKYLYKKRSLKNITKILELNKETFNVCKILYISSDKVIDLSKEEYLCVIKKNIFRYEDMDIVVKKV